MRATARTATALTVAAIVAACIFGLGTGAARAGHSDLGCAGCHVPHNAGSAIPLWNPDIGETDLQEYYFSSTMDATASAPDGASKMCLSCHDGTFTGVESEHVFGTAPEAGAGSLTASHPVSFVYDQNLASTDGQLQNPDTLEPGVLDVNSKMQCTSCHEVHDNGLDTEDALRWQYNSDLGSGVSATFCRHCHIK